jgi:hypothetical protein
MPFGRLVVNSGEPWNAVGNFRAFVSALAAHPRRRRRYARASTVPPAMQTRTTQGGTNGECERERGDDGFVTRRATARPVEPVA